MKIPDYNWTCHACNALNPSGTTSCASCGCPAIASAQQIKKYSHEPTATAPSAALIRLATIQSHFWLLFTLSASLFICSLVLPSGKGQWFAGAFMLVLGPLALRFGFFSWLANPLLLITYVILVDTRNPAAARSLSRWTLGFMLLHLFEALTVIKTWPDYLYYCWLLSGLVLVYAIRRYQTFVTALETAGGIASVDADR
jgi:hypothetical protein